MKEVELEYAETVEMLAEFLKKHKVPFEYVNIRDDQTGIETAAIRFLDGHWAEGKRLIRNN